MKCSQQMTLRDTNVKRLLALGVAGFSVAADSLSAIRYAKVKLLRKDGVTYDFKVGSNFPK